MNERFVNTCDTKCPRKALLALELRSGTGIRDGSPSELGQLFTSGALGAIGNAIKAGMEGVAQAARVTTCPQRGLSPEEWSPQEECAQYVAGVLAEHRVNWDELTQYEQRVLRPYISGDPPNKDEG